MAQEVLGPTPKALAQVCSRFGVRRLWVFGSFARGEADAESDLDLLVEFQPGKVPGLDFLALENELSRLLGRRVDLHTPRSLSRYFREEVLKEARPLYEETEPF
ncbi:nucleotidyltransferase family protein [Thermus caldifontis]|uniref:nucleotidyltransferase family protein n=1 Tax=Thermus caldifontis TaxID=1930763 RepID=UPI000DF337C0|nr:nucleotidyltransferase family protein [Thermus caldifontis]